MHQNPAIYLIIEENTNQLAYADNEFYTNQWEINIANNQSIWSGTFCKGKNLSMQ